LAAHKLADTHENSQTLKASGPVRCNKREVKVTADRIVGFEAMTVAANKRLTELPM
jgi:hypothetical protein